MAPAKQIQPFIRCKGKDRRTCSRKVARYNGTMVMFAGGNTGLHPKSRDHIGDCPLCGTHYTVTDGEIEGLIKEFEAANLTNAR
jgi:hypothetical protein